MARKRSEKRTALQQWQKRARDKESRIRAKGATPESVAILSPRKSWQDVQNMSAPEKRSYIAKLKKFTSRQTKVVVTDQHVALSASTLSSTQAAVASYNAKVRKTRERIDNIKVDRRIPGAGNISTIKQRQRERNLEREGTKGKFRVRGAAASALYEITVEEPPANEDVAKRRNKQMLEMDKRTWAEKREKLRDSAIDMLRRIGDDEMADYIKAMTTTQWEVLSQRTDFFDSLAVAYHPSAGSKAAGKTPEEAALEVEQRGDTIVKGDYEAIARIVCWAVR